MNSRPVARLAALSRNRTLLSLMVRPLILPLLVIVLVSAALVASLNRSADNAHYADDSQGRLMLLRLMMTDIAQMENGQRGYVITGQQSQLRAYQDSKKLFEKHVGTYRQRIITERQRVRLGELLDSVEQWETKAAQPEIQARKTSLAAAAARISEGTGLQLTAEARRVLLDMTAFENQRLSRALKESDAALRRVQLLTPLGLILSLALLAFAVRNALETLTLSMERLTEGTRQIADGHYADRVEPLGVRELDLLSAQFHQMAEAVQQRERQLEENSLSLQRTNESLQRSNRELERFAYVASHDLQEPLRTIGSYTELIARRYSDKLDARGEQYIKFTISATHRLKNLIQDLLVFSRVHRTGRSFDAVDTALLVQQVKEELQVKLAEVGGQLDVGPLPTITGNRELLHHIFLNLLGNALKFRAPERSPQITVRAEREEGAWRFSVQDNGIGIEPQYHERIFEVFQRLHGVGEYEGSGIGLAVTRNAVEQHSGRIWLESVPGEGTTFFFTLPDAAPTPPENPL